MKKQVATLVTISLLTGACGEFIGSDDLVQAKLQEINEGAKPAGEERPSCEIDYADYQLDTHLLGFEITDKSNIGFGFNLITGFFRALGLSIKTEKGKMFMSMHLSESLRPTETIANVTGEGESKQTDFNMDLDLLRLGLDIGYYYKTPVSQLTEKTLKNSLSRLSQEMSRVETPWHSRVVYQYKEQSQLIIPAGSVAGIRVGDKFNIYNVDYAWRQEPCTSELLMERKRTLNPLAVAEVIQLEKNASLLTLVEYNSEEPIEYGAKVEIAQLSVNANGSSRKLLHSIRLRDFKSEPLNITSGAQVDFSLYMSEQTQALLNQYGYYPRK